MSKVYSNKALPAGTVLREWRLEEVLGVGGFGIVYKARGIYFDELVAIKEYFPSSISERQEDDTIVAVDSDAEEVHALGLKKFVEEAKLLWNLSTPSRHPNIVSVRSLFEIHGTAYMVMDFEDGVSLSKLLKDGRRFNQASLTALIKPIAEGLERAHRVGVLHRDIKPANMLVAPDGRPVLIDFGSARFESGEATSTTVTFHTPPYAAIEQYVKTYEQGPWTDVYALGVVLYECVTGEKPSEVLERLHGNANKPLAEGEWPGFSRGFLTAVDAAMTIRPDERPRSIAEWLPMISMEDDAVGAVQPAAPAVGEETIVSIMRSSTDDIKPVAPPAPGFETAADIRTAVPERPSQAEFKGAGQTTRGELKTVSEPIRASLAEAEAAVEVKEAKPVPATTLMSAQPTATPTSPSAKAKPGAGAKPPVKTDSNRVPLIAVGALALVLAIGGGWFLVSGGLSGDDAGEDAAQTSQTSPSGTVNPDQIAAVAAESGYAFLVGSLAADAKAAGAPASATAPLTEASGQLKTLEGQLAGLADTSPARAGTQAKVAALASSAAIRFVEAIAAETESKSQRLAREIPWAAPGRSRAGNQQQQGIAATLTRTRGALNAARNTIRTSPSPSAAIATARQALAASQGYSQAYFAAFRAGPAAGKQQSDVASARLESQSADAPVTSSPVRVTPAPVAQSNSNDAVTFSSTRAEFATVVASARSAAAEIKQLGNIARPGADATDTEKTRYQIRVQNAQTAKRYEDYLSTLSRSMGGTTSESEARQSLAKANQTMGYLSPLLRSSRAAAR